jgi:hypothetical protein
LWLLIAGYLLFVGACGNTSDGGPPGAPCSEEVQSHAPICGEPCTDACGCKGCTDGTTRTIDETVYVCQGNCYFSGVGPKDSGGSGGSAGSEADSGPQCGDPPVCDPPAICNQCQSPCCCDPCVDGESTTIDGGLYLCGGGCWNPV